MAPSANFRHHNLTWNKPLLSQAVEYLAAGWSGLGPLDLSSQLVIVPTRQSGRRLREALATHAQIHQQAVFPPRVVQPETLARLGAPTVGIASRLTSLLAWTMVLRNLPLDSFRAVFPVDPPTRDFAWARRLANQFMRLQATLAETGLRMTEVRIRMGGDFPEAQRWTQLAELEQLFDCELAAHGLRDVQMAKLHFASAPTVPPGITRIIVLATPDPLPLAMEILQRYAERVPVEVVVYGPSENEEGTPLFDSWGRPLAEIWNRRLMDWTDFSTQVHLCADPAAQADLIAGLAQAYPKPEEMLAVGVADPEVLGPLENGFSRIGVPVFNPEARFRRSEGLYALLVLLAELVSSEAFGTIAAFLRCPVVIDWLRGRAGPEFSSTKLLVELDDLHAGHLPPTLDAARAHAGKFPLLAHALSEVAELRAVLLGGSFPANALKVLQSLYAVKQVDAGSRLADSAEAWTLVTDETSLAMAVFPVVSLGESWDLALAIFAEDQSTIDKPVGAIDLNGWLELLWEDAPHLVVAGMNDGRVPEAIVGDAFLPESLRAQLGLKTNAARFARDAYLFAALAAMRATLGRLDVTLGKVSPVGDPLRPSRLLLTCTDAELPGRIAYLFDKIETAQASLPWTRAWGLQPRLVSPPTKLSVTALRDYLACPFRFYLKHVLKMEPVDLTKAELDARDFGTLLHAALQVMGEDEQLRSCVDETVLRDALLGTFERKALSRFGRDLALPLVVQFESARQRLRAAAAVQARESAAGWKIERVEWSFAVPLGGLTVRGKIDRLDRHVDGRVRVLDYKSSDRSSTPLQAHLGPVGSGGSPEWARVMITGKERLWRDLQLPLYRHAVAAEFGTSVECGYFNLPKATGDTAVCLWDGFSPELQTAAEDCARRVAESVAAGRFWPPAEPSPEDDGDWASLFHHGTAASVATGWSLGGTQ